MSLPRSTALRRFATLLLLAAWFVASNHCALGLMQGARVAKDHAGCCSHEKQQHAPVKECCKRLQGLLPTAEKFAAVPPTPGFAPEWLALFEKMYAGPVGKTDAAWFETGPPRETRSFAELVLQRSLRSHAPPSAA